MDNKTDLLAENKTYLERKQSTLYKIYESIGVLTKTLLIGDIFGFKSILKRKKTNIQIRANTTIKIRYPQLKTKYMNERVAVYMALFGDIDSIFEPLVVDDNCDYYIITDQDVSCDSIWKKKDVDMSVVDEYNNRQKNRYYKMHAQELFPEYAYCIYLDSNIYIYGLLSELIQYVNPESGIGIHNMPNRGNVYEEIYARSLINPRDSRVLERQKNDYRQMGFKNEEGMFECNVIITKTGKESTKIMDRWWEEYKKYPARDQVSFPFILWDLGISQDKIGIIGNCMRLNPYFRIEEHVIQ
ncbi:glycosyltransferase domain-containing protein [Butyrivibrio sp. YAB3001]|uniref:glycosyltransferase domain-containing protein n=1 Tax=Butyrivibrio sp. YAB3001 TaxID=1520812 RepID=UPI0008F643A7|nr:glycosyltransferase domain-containing protein [Butyrivibrio sp. YAB3001]SFB88884.1 Protein of unknown function [Butyrivibrio sp. YAB3001]